MPNSDQDARSDMPREPEPSPASAIARPDRIQEDDADGPSRPAPAAGEADLLAPRARPARRRKPVDTAAPDAASPADPSQAPVLQAPVPADPLQAPVPADASAAAPATPRAAPRRRTARTSPPAAAPEPQAGPADVPPPEAPASEEPAETVAVATPDRPALAPQAPDAQAEAPAAASPAVAAPSGTPRPPEPRPSEPAPAAPAPARPLVITASDAALAVVNPHPIRANDRPDGYLYHLTSPGEARALMQSGLPCSFDDPIILTERGGIPYWLSVLSEDVDDILDGPAAVTVLRIRRRAVQNAIEADADSTRAAQAPCYLLTGVSGLPPAPPAPPPPLLRARPPAPAATGEAPDPGAGVEMGGTVKWYNPRKGFGFITPGAGGKDVFVHASTLERAGLAQLVDGQTVRMQVIQGAKGPEAASLSLA